MVIPFWESGYGDVGISTMGGPSHEVIVLGEALHRAGLHQRQVLDLGSGEGRNSLFLGGLGHLVTAVDTSEKATAKLRLLSLRNGSTVRTEKARIEEWPLTRTYDVILAHGALHFVEREKLLPLIRQLQDATNPGGVHIFTLALFDDGCVISEFLESGHQNPLAAGELLSLYQGWELVLFESYRKWDAHPGLGEHNHPIEKWMFFKKGAFRVPIKSTYVKAALTSGLGEDFSRVRVGAQYSCIEEIFGLADRQYVFRAPGLQLSSTRASMQGYELTLNLYNRFVFYVVDGVVVGKAEHYRDFCELQVDVGGATGDEV
jgi:SAM-dependent methyltransferase